MYGKIFKEILGTAALIIACVLPCLSFAQNFPAGVTPPEDFDYSVIEFDELLSKKYGDDLVDYDKAVSGCMDFKGKTPQPEDMLYTEESLSVLEKCMAGKGFRFREVNDFTLYKQLPSNKNLQDMLDAAENFETVPPSDSSAAVGMISNEVPPSDVPAEAITEKQPVDTKETDVPAKQTQKPKGPLPNRLFVPVE